MSAAVWCDDELHRWYPAVNCLHCGRFVGRDGAIYVEHFEMSSEIASLDGECARCLAAAVPSQDSEQ